MAKYAETTRADPLQVSVNFYELIGQKGDDSLRQGHTQGSRFQIACGQAGRGRVHTRAFLPEDRNRIDDASQVTISILQPVANTFEGAPTCAK